MSESPTNTTPGDMPGQISDDQLAQLISGELEGADRASAIEALRRDPEAYALFTESVHLLNDEEVIAESFDEESLKAALAESTPAAAASGGGRTEVDHSESAGTESDGTASDSDSSGEESVLPGNLTPPNLAAFPSKQRVAGSAGRGVSRRWLGAALAAAAGLFALIRIPVMFAPAGLLLSSAAMVGPSVDLVSTDQLADVGARTAVASASPAFSQARTPQQTGALLGALHVEFSVARAARLSTLERTIGERILRLVSGLDLDVGTQSTFFRLSQGEEVSNESLTSAERSIADKLGIEAFSAGQLLQALRVAGDVGGAAALVSAVEASGTTPATVLGALVLEESDLEARELVLEALDDPSNGTRLGRVAEDLLARVIL